MTQIKPFLKNTRKLNLEIRAKKRQRECLYSLVTGTAIRYDIDKVQTSPTGDRLDKVMADVADLDKTITEYIKMLSQKQKEAMIMIESLNKPEYRAILTDYYINAYSWHEVANMNGYSEGRAKHIGNEAIQALIKVSTK